MFARAESPNLIDLGGLVSCAPANAALLYDDDGEPCWPEIECSAAKLPAAVESKASEKVAAVCELIAVVIGRKSRRLD